MQLDRDKETSILFVPNLYYQDTVTLTFQYI